MENGLRFENFRKNEPHRHIGVIEIRIRLKTN